MLITFLSHEYSLRSVAFSSLLQLIPILPSIDLFASKSNAKLDRYCSWFYDPLAFKINTFSFSWPDACYLFPPINLISKCLKKIIIDNVKFALLITPAWPGLLSLPIILLNLCGNPIFIPHDHLEGSYPTRYPFPMMAWIISSVPARTKVYQLQLPTPSSKALLPPLSAPTLEFGQSFVNMLMKRGPYSNISVNLNR